METRSKLRCRAAVYLSLFFAISPVLLTDKNILHDQIYYAGRKVYGGDGIMVRGDA